MDFKDPPERYRKRKQYEWLTIYQTLHDNPGQWALIEEQGNHSIYTAVTQGKVSGFHPDMGVEMRTANNALDAKPRTCDLYARYNPDLDTSLTVKERQKVWVEIRRIEKEKKMKVSTVESEE